MPIRRHLCPDDWPAISLEVRTAGGWCCEWCKAPNKAVIQRKPNGTDWVEVLTVQEPALDRYELTEELDWKRLRFHGLTRIVLSVAHLDRNPANNQRDNLAALCQRCHLRHDIYQHVCARKYGRAHDEQPQLF